MDFGFLEVPVITIICLLVGLFVKGSPLDNRWIPSIVGTVGGILGFAGVFVIPDLMHLDVLSGTAVGIVSGLAATGAHQLYVQIAEGFKDV
jgi:hypothetical protein